MSLTTVALNETRQRFEIPVGEEFAYLDFRWHNGLLALMHTFVPPEERGQNLAGQLAAFALNYARERHVKILVYCPFVAQYLQHHPEFNDLVVSLDHR
jgi:predicted GNAT family acetyltransferase